MSNNAKNRRGFVRFVSAAANCKKVLKNLKKIEMLKVKAAAVSAGAIVVSAAAVISAAALGSDKTVLSAVPEIPAASAAVVTPIPPKEYNVKISVDGKNIGVKCSGTVSDALSAAGVSVYDDDLINIGFSEPLNDRTNIVVNRVDIVEEVEVKTIEYATKYREDDSYTIGYTETVVDGEEGEIETTKRLVYVDGELISTAVIGKDVTDPVDEVILVGTKEEEPEPEPEPVYEAPAPAYTSDVALDANGAPLSYSQVLTGSSCAYTASAGSLTSTGRTAAVGLVAVNPNIIPYGTELYITSADGSKVYGYAIAADTGGAVMRGSIIVDLFMNTESDCYDWGRRDVNVYFLN
ncbi:MAG: G5 domain-containing protein [Oscillospiraceae bacterium]|nr:G5 domain-containing protein [Oscillospiraceae bacterium]